MMQDESLSSDIDPEEQRATAPQQTLQQDRNTSGDGVDDIPSGEEQLDRNTSDDGVENIPSGEGQRSPSEIRSKAVSMLQEENGEPSNNDQLPDVEEYKASQGSHQPGVKWITVFLIVVTVLVMASVFAAVGVMVAKNKNRSAEQPLEDTGATSTATGSDFQAERVTSIRNMAEGNEWSDERSLNTVGSPQDKAVRWVANLDGMAIPLSDMETIKTRYALAVLYYGLDGDDWARRCDFLDNEHVCEWFHRFVGPSGMVRVGVDCNDENEVTNIFLPYLDLSGSLPSEIGLLDSLVELDLSGNDLSQQLPTELSRLTKLEKLILHNNGLTGSVPTFLSQMSSLKELHLASNNIGGSFPKGFASLPYLYMLNADDTFLESMENLAGLSNLEALFLGSNVVKGGLTSELLASWPKLEVLDLNLNYMKEGLPDNLFSRTNLVAVDLSGNYLNGSIPLESPPPGMKMQFLNLNNNNLTGTIPGELRYLEELRHLDLSLNYFTGEFPRDVGFLDNLEYLFVAYNDRLSPGPIPDSIGNLRYLRDLSLKDSNRNGPIPDSFNKLDSIYLLDLDQNQLNGTVPEFLGDLSTLRFLFLNRNLFTGYLPQSLSTLSDLYKLVVSGNSLSGSMEYMCDLDDNALPRQPALDELVADCKDLPDNPGTAEVECTCCKCCNDQELECQNVVYFSDLEPMWENGFVREKYVFKENEIDLGTYDLSDDDEASDSYSDEGYFPDQLVDWADNDNYEDVYDDDDDDDEEVDEDYEDVYDDFDEYDEDEYDEDDDEDEDDLDDFDDVDDEDEDEDEDDFDVDDNDNVDDYDGDVNNGNADYGSEDGEFVGDADEDFFDGDGQWFDGDDEWFDGNDEW